jgi:hypothetical protein
MLVTDTSLMTFQFLTNKVTFRTRSISNNYESKRDAIQLRKINRFTLIRGETDHVSVKNFKFSSD